MLKSLYIFCFIPLLGTAQGISRFGGGRSMGLAHSNVALVDAWSVLNNPAAMAFLESGALGTSYENRFLLRETNDSKLVYSHLVGSGALGVHLGHFGFEYFNQFRFGIAYAQTLHQGLSASVAIHHISNSINRGAHKLHSFNTSMGLLFRATSKLQLGFHLDAPEDLFREEKRLDYQVMFRIGFCYAPSEALSAFGELEKTLLGQEDLKLGLEYTAKTHFHFRIGLRTRAFRPALGLGYTRGQLQADLGMEYLHHLGNSTSVSIQYVLK